MTLLNGSTDISYGADRLWYFWCCDVHTKFCGGPLTVMLC